MRRFTSTIIYLLFLCITQFSAANAVVKPSWKNGDLRCPAPSTTDRYIEVPVFHDLKKEAEIDRIPGLKTYNDVSELYRGMTIKVYYELFQEFDPNKKLLILIPGGPGQPHADLHEMDLSQAKHLKNFNIIVMDHRGVGCSTPTFPGKEPPQALLMRQAASDIEWIRRELVGESGGINVWGYSYGSVLAQTYALLYPNNLERLYLGGAVGSANEWNLSGIQYDQVLFSGVEPEARDRFLELLQPVPELKKRFYQYSFYLLYSYFGRTQDIPKKIEKLTPLLEAEKYQEAESDLPVSRWILPWMTRSIACMELFPFKTKYSNEFPMFEQITGACDEFEEHVDYFDYSELLRQIDAPTLVFGGWYDHVTPAEAMIRIARSIPKSFLYLDRDMGHSFSGKRSCFIKFIDEFFGGASDPDLQAISYSDECQANPVQPPTQEQSSTEPSSFRH